MSVALRPFTYDDLAALPDDQTRYEIWNGELIVAAAPTPLHQLIVGDLRDLLAAFVRPRQLGWVFMAPVDVVLSPFDVVEPDIVFVDASRRHLIGGKAINGAPDLVMEVLSPSTRRVDLIQKQALYAKNGIPEYWLIDPVSRSISVLQLMGAMYQSGSGATDIARSVLLPDFTVDVPALFANLPVIDDE